MTKITRMNDKDGGLGSCPECGGMTGCCNIGRDHWGYCAAHRIAWYIGSNLFSGWKEESEADWEKNARFLATFRGYEQENGASDPSLGGGEDDPSLDETAASQAGCAVCNPTLRPTVNEAFRKREAAWRKDLHIARLGDDYHLLLIPGRNGKPFESWPGPYDTEAAAKMSLESLVACAAEGQPNNAYCSGDIVDYFNIAGRLLEWLGEDNEENQSLAHRLASEQPWKKKPQKPFVDDGLDIPF